MDTICAGNDTICRKNDTIGAGNDTFSSGNDTIWRRNDTFGPGNDTFCRRNDTFCPGNDTFDGRNDTILSGKAIGRRGNAGAGASNVDAEAGCITVVRRYGGGALAGVAARAGFAIRIGRYVERHFCKGPLFSDEVPSLHTWSPCRLAPVPSRFPLLLPLLWRRSLSLPNNKQTKNK